MKKRYGLGVTLGGWFRGPRAMFAIAPLVVPLILSTVSTIPSDPLPPSLPAPQIEPIDYAAMLAMEPEPLPEHSIVLTIERGDTLQAVLERGGLSRPDAFSLSAGFAENIDPRRLRPGEIITFRMTPEAEVREVEMKITGWGRVTGTRSESGFVVTADEAVERFEEVVVSGTITSSLGEAVLAAGETHELVNSLVDVFQWDVDFFRLKAGDSFTAIVDRRYVGEDHLGYGPVRAAVFTHEGQTYEAFRYEGDYGAGYYTRSGSPLRKQFLKSPLKFSRITSGFNLRRFHPVLKTVRPHYGVDYGAPTGTPVMATADGVVVSAHFGRGEGNFVRLRHSRQIESYYLHLSRFASGIRPGTRVSQGDVIGYVGSTGLSTAPHLDYRVREKGSWINPVNLRSVTADPLTGRDLSAFRQQVATLLPRVDPAVRLASADRGQTNAR